MNINTSASQPHTDEVSARIKKFQKFIKTEIESALDELKGIKKEANRKHLQKLVYVNLVNQFDLLIDALLLDFAVHDSDFRRRVLKETKEEPVLMKDLYEILLSDDVKSATESRLKDIVRLKYLNLRHSSKLRILLRECFDWTDSDLQRPRVFVNNGSLFKDVTRAKPHKIPDTAIGYADRLYARRNSLVHHDKPEITKSDTVYIEQKFEIRLSRSISLKLSSIKSAAKFYSDLTRELNSYLGSVAAD